MSLAHSGAYSRAQAGLKHVIAQGETNATNVSTGSARSLLRILSFSRGLFGVFFQATFPHFCQSVLFFGPNQRNYLEVIKLKLFIVREPVILVVLTLLANLQKVFAYFTFSRKSS